MSRVQSIERAFAVLGALADGPIGVTEVAERVDLPKSTAARLLASLAARGRRRAGARATPATGSARGSSRSPPRSGRPDRWSSLARPDARGPGRRGRRGGRPVGPRRRPRPLRRPGRHAQPGLGPRLDRDADPDARGVVRAGAPGLRAADVRPALPRPADGALHAGRWSPRTPCWSACARSAGRLRLGAGEFDEGITSVAAPIADGSGEIVAAVHLHGPSYRFPAPGDTDALAALVVASAARISESLRQAG